MVIFKQREKVQVKRRGSGMPEGPLRQPSADLGMFVSGIVIDDEVDCESRGHALVEVTQEGEKLLMAAARLTLSQLLVRLDQAIDKALTLRIYTDEISG